MSRKGDLSINTIVVAALAITVLIIMIFVFKDQIGRAAGGFTTIGNDAKQGINGTKCETILGDRLCASSSNISSLQEKYKADLVPAIIQPGKEWDCPNGQTCYEVRRK